MVGSYWTLILLEIVGRLDGRGLQTPATYGILVLTKSKAIMNPALWNPPWLRI